MGSPPANNEHQAPKCTGACGCSCSSGTAGAAVHSPRPPFTHPPLPSTQSTWLSKDALRRTRLAPCIYLTAKYPCFSLFSLTGCKLASGWQLQAGTAWEEPQGQLQAWFCQATEGCPMPQPGHGSRVLQIRLLAMGSLSPGQMQEIPKSLQGAWLPSSSS